MLSVGLVLESLYSRSYWPIEFMMVYANVEFVFHFSFTHMLVISININM